jgi:hypothetical protein
MRTFGVATFFLLAVLVSSGAPAQLVQSDGPLSSTCPYGSSLNDGCAGAQLHGVIPYPHIADYKRVVMVNVVGGSGYTNGTDYGWTSSGGGCSVNATGTVDVVGGALTNGMVITAGNGCTSRPAISVPTAAGSGRGGRIVPSVYQLTPHNADTTFNLAGVDYPVGYDSSLMLKDPTSDATLPSCASFSGTTVTISSSGCTLNGFDFSLYSTNLRVAGNLTGTVITNNKFEANSNHRNQIVFISSGSCDVTMKYNQLDGGAKTAAGSGFRLIANVNSSCHSGQITFEYNYCFDFDSKCINLAGNPTSSSTLSMTEKYNLYAQIALCRSGCSHGEAQYSYSAFTSGPVLENIQPWTMQFNVALTLYSHAPTQATAQMAIEADAVNITDADVRYNYVLVPGPGAATRSNNSSPPPIVSSGAIFCGYQENGNNAFGVMLHNYLDYTGAYFPYNTSGRTCTRAFPSISDINAVTGHSCNPRSCN